MPTELAVKPGYVLGHCSACNALAEQSPRSRHWWHVDAPACPNTGPFLFQPVVVEDGCMRVTTPQERPSRFLPGPPDCVDREPEIGFRCELSCGHDGPHTYKGGTWPDSLRTREDNTRGTD